MPNSDGWRGNKDGGWICDQAEESYSQGPCRTTVWNGPGPRPLDSWFFGPETVHPRRRTTILRKTFRSVTGVGTVDEEGACQKRGIHVEFSTPAQQLLNEDTAGRLGRNNNITIDRPNQYVGTAGSIRWTKTRQLDGN